MKKLSILLVLLMTIMIGANLQAQEKKFIKRTVEINKDFKRLTKGVSGKIEINLSDNEKLVIMNKSSHSDTDEHFLFRTIDGKTEYVKVMIRTDMKPPFYAIEVTDFNNESVNGMIMNNKMIIGEMGSTDYGLVLDMLEDKVEVLKRIKKAGGSYTVEKE